MMNCFGNIIGNILCFIIINKHYIATAIDIKDIDVVKLILMKSANVHLRIPGHPHITLLHHAISSHSYMELTNEKNKISTEICKLLIDKGIDIEEKNTSGQTAFLLYAETATGSIINGEVEDLFIKSGANIHTIDASGNGLLYYACKNNNYDLVIKLFRRGIDYSIKLEYNNTIFMWLCYEFYNKYDPDIFDMLMETSDINQANDQGDTALTIACNNQNHGCIVKLLDNGADINLPGHEGNTPLLIAAKYNNKFMIEILTDRGADINHKNKWNETPLSISCKYNSTYAIDYYLRYGYFDNKILRYYDIQMMNYMTASFEQYFYVRHIYNKKKEILNEYFSETNLSRIILEYTYYRLELL